jgi:hypothetical protein
MFERAQGFESCHKVFGAKRMAERMSGFLGLATLR